MSHGSKLAQVLLCDETRLALALSESGGIGFIPFA